MLISFKVDTISYPNGEIYKTYSPVDGWSGSIQGQVAGNDSAKLAYTPNNTVTNRVMKRVEDYLSTRDDPTTRK